MASRIQRLATVLQENGVDAFFAQTTITMDYLHGFAESSHERFLTLAIRANGDVRLICPALSASQAERAGITDIQGWTDSENPNDLISKLAQDWGLKSGILAVDDDMPAHMLLRLQSVLPAALFKPGNGLVGEIMRKKDQSELDLMAKAARIADDAFLEIPKHLKVGMTELEIERKLRDLMRDMGGSPTFCIIGVDAGAAEPHHLNGDTPLKHGSVLLMDFGCEVEGYQSDITRTVAFGEASPKAAEVYKIVYAAHMAAREASKEAGATGASVDAAARKVITDAGYGPLFMHRTGHGIGRHGHEDPYIVDSNTRPLEPGECYSIEPGIYIAGEFGIRIENIVTHTAAGCVSQNDEPSADMVVLGS